MNYYVYETLNTRTGKSYIGMRQTSKPIDKDFYLGSGILFNKVLKKYGVKNFKKIILYIGDSRKDISDKEIFWIKTKNTIRPYGYNLSSGGEGGNLGSIVNKKISIASKKRIQRGGYFSEETKNKLRDRRKGLEFNENWKTNISKKRIGTSMSEETKTKISLSSSGENNGMYGKKHSDSAKEKIRKSKLGIPPWNKGLKKL
jgi:group I intron endonuclease